MDIGYYFKLQEIGLLLAGVGFTGMYIKRKYIGDIITALAIFLHMFCFNGLSSLIINVIMAIRAGRIVSNLLARCLLLIAAFLPIILFVMPLEINYSATVFYFGAYLLPGIIGLIFCVKQSKVTR